jgi:micrococcal nuclease
MRAIWVVKAGAASSFTIPACNSCLISLLYSQLNECVMKRLLKYSPERWLGLGLFLAGIFCLGLFWPAGGPFTSSTQSAETISRGSAQIETQKTLPSSIPRPTELSPSALELEKTIPESDVNPPSVPVIPAAFQGSGSPTSPRVACRVLMVFDGDTLACDINGDARLQKPEEEIRLLGIDSPEMHYSRKNPSYGSSHPQDEPFAKEASQWLTQQAQGKTLYLESDLRSYDRYGRRLAYVYTNPQATSSLNEQALTSGYCQTLFIGKNRRYEERFKVAEQTAQKRHIGLWSGHF